MDRIYSQLVDGLKKFSQRTHLSKAVIGLSGGVDSSLTFRIAVDAFHSRNVIALVMPELGVTAQENIFHAQKLAEYFDVKYYKIPINPYMVDFNHLPWKGSDLAHGNTKARIRMAMLYHYANSFKSLVLGTSNKSEILLGYGTKFGDLAADVEVIGELYKTDVWRLADHVGIPPEIVNKVPTAELHPGQTDEKELGASYKELDSILKNIGLGFDAMVSKGMNPTLVRKVMTQVKKNEHKRNMPPVLQIRK